MKRQIKQCAMAGALMISLAITGSAAWPPSTSVEEGAGTRDHSENDRFRQSHTPSERLANDTRRLEELLNDLKEDVQELERSSDTRGTGASTPAPKE